jgi:signal transduction histidine kinase
VITIAAKPGDADGTVAISVSDEGIGMSEEVKARSTEMFFTTKDPSTSGHDGGPHKQGTGMGLALVSSMVQRVGGQMRIESEVGKGTTVTMILPIARAEKPLGEQEMYVVARGMSPDSARTGI